MRIRVTDPGSRDANQNVSWTDFRNRNGCTRYRFSDVGELYRSHDQNSSLVTPWLVTLPGTLKSKSAWRLFLLGYTSNSEDLAGKDLTLRSPWPLLQNDAGFKHFVV